MNVSFEQKEQTLLVRLTGEIDHHCAQTLRGRVDAVIQRSRPDKLILDFSGVNFMDSSGIGFIMGRFRLMKSSGGSLSVTGAGDRLMMVMKLAGLEKLHILSEQEEDKPYETHQ